MRSTLVAYACVAVALLCVPIFGIYPVFMMKLLCFAMFACAYNLLLGFGRMPSFGHAAFFGSAHGSRAPERGSAYGAASGSIFTRFAVTAPTATNTT